MNIQWKEIQTQWTQYRPYVKATFQKLSEKQMDGIGGDRDRLLGLIRDEYGYSDKEANEAVDQFVSTIFATTPEPLQDEPAKPTAIHPVHKKSHHSRPHAHR